MFFLIFNVKLIIIWLSLKKVWKNDYGASIGRILLQGDAVSLRTRARASRQAGSDARMNGCELPVVIVSGSGNQGITASVPVVVYAQALKVSEEKRCIEQYCSAIWLLSI